MQASKPESGTGLKDSFIRAGAWAWLLFICPAVPAVAAAVDVVRVALTPFQSNSGLFIAEREGFFAAERIRISWAPFSSGQQTIPLLTQGVLDVGSGGASAALFNVIAAGQKVRLVAGMGHGTGAGSLGSLVVRKDLAGIVRSVADLKGRKIAVNGIGTLGHYFAARVMARGNVSLNQVTLVVMPIAASIAALERGAIDAAVMNSPFDTEAIEIGMGFRLVDFSDVMPGEPTSFLMFGPTLLEQNRPLGERFMAAYLRGARRYAEGPTPRNVAIVAEYLKVEAAMVRKSTWTGVFADGFVDGARLRRYQDWLFDIGLINVRNPMTTVIETYYVDQARAALGVVGR